MPRKFLIFSLATLLSAGPAFSESRLGPGVKPPVKKTESAPKPIETMETKKNKKGKVDRWIYKRDGSVYKREYDRNGDGKPDFRVIEDHGIFVQKEYDLRYDGTFDKIEKAPLRGSSGRIKTISGQEVPS